MLTLELLEELKRLNATQERIATALEQAVVSGGKTKPEAATPRKPRTRSR